MLGATELSFVRSVQGLADCSRFGSELVYWSDGQQKGLQRDLTVLAGIENVVDSSLALGAKKDTSSRSVIIQP
jgi:hypothetical protein